MTILYFSIRSLFFLSFPQTAAAHLQTVRVTPACHSTPAENRWSRGSLERKTLDDTHELNRVVTDGKTDTVFIYNSGTVMKALAHVTAIGRVRRKRKKSRKTLVAAHLERAVRIIEICNQKSSPFTLATARFVSHVEGRPSRHVM